MPDPDTTNKFLVSAAGDGIGVLRWFTLRGPISAEDALNLAAWLAALADPTGEQFDRVLDAVRST